MSGFLVGTGSGIVASVMVYYTISASMRESTQALRSDLHNSTTLLNQSFDPQTPVAPSALVGPRYPASPPFGELLRLKWNEAITKTVTGVRDTDWGAMGAGVVESGLSAVAQLSGSPVPTAEEAAGAVKDKAQATLREAKDTTERVGRDVTASLREDGRTLREEVKRTYQGAMPSLREAEDKTREIGRDISTQLKDDAEGLKKVAEQKGKSWWSSLKSTASGASREAQSATKNAGSQVTDDARGLVRAAQDAGRHLPPRIKEEGHHLADVARHAVERAKEVSDEAMDKLTDYGGTAKRAAAAAVGVAEKEADKAVKKVEYSLGGGGGILSAGGFVTQGGNLRGETFTGGAAVKVKAKRAAEGNVEGRLV